MNSKNTPLIFSAFANGFVGTLLFRTGVQIVQVHGVFCHRCDNMLTINSYPTFRRTTPECTANRKHTLQP